MLRRQMLLPGLALVAACAGDTPATRDQPAAGARTDSPYSAGSDSGAVRQPVAGTNTGVEFEAPRVIPGVLASLAQVKRQPDQQNLTAFKGGLGRMEDAMRSDLARVGLADTGEFQALTDSMARDLGGGAGSLVDEPKAGEVPRLEMRVRRLIQVHEQMMGSVRK